MILSNYFQLKDEINAILKESWHMTKPISRYSKNFKFYDEVLIKFFIYSDDKTKRQAVLPSQCWLGYRGTPGFLSSRWILSSWSRNPKIFYSQTIF